MKDLYHQTVPIVIAHFNAPEELRETIRRIENQDGITTCIYVRDNSIDNILFTAAINEGLRQYSYKDEYEYILVLNQDAILQPECLMQMIKAMNFDQRIGICGPVALSKDQSVNWAGSNEAFPWGRHLGFNLTQLPRTPFETYWVNGACMLLRTAMIREIGLLDENMKFICSDADYSFTARSRGWKCFVIPTAFVSHEPSGSADVHSAWLSKIKLKDQLYFAKKWLNGDLYKHLAFEGPQLTADYIQNEVIHTEACLANMEAK